MASPIYDSNVLERQCFCIAFWDNETPALHFDKSDDNINYAWKRTFVCKKEESSMIVVLHVHPCHLLIAHHIRDLSFSFGGISFFFFFFFNWGKSCMKDLICITCYCCHHFVNYHTSDAWSNKCLYVSGRSSKSTEVLQGISKHPQETCMLFIHITCQTIFLFQLK